MLTTAKLSVTREKLLMVSNQLTWCGLELMQEFSTTVEHSLGLGKLVLDRFEFITPCSDNIDNIRSRDDFEPHNCLGAFSLQLIASRS
jgi:hypothetical protein